MALTPGGTTALVNYANSLNYAGRPEEAIALFQKVFRLSPGGLSFLYRDFGNVLQNTGRYEEAVSAYKKALQLAPDDINAHRGLAATYSMMGREKEASAEAAEVLRINPKFSLDFWVKTHPYVQSEIDKLVNALRKAGLK